MKLIYTSIFGDYDKLWEPKVINDDWEYICFTDKHYDSDVWNISIVDNPHPDSTKSSKYIKIMTNPLSEDDIYVWIDGSIEIQDDINEFINSIDNSCNLSMQVHPFNKTLEQELYACTWMKKDNADLMKQQVSRYKLQQPYQFTQNNIIVKRYGVDESMCVWWNEVKNWSKRDQLSFVWSMQRKNQEYCTFSNEIADKYFKWHKLHPK